MSTDKIDRNNPTEVPPKDALSGLNITFGRPLLLPLMAVISATLFEAVRRTG